MLHQTLLIKQTTHTVISEQQWGLELNILATTVFSSFSHTDVESQLLAVEFQEGLRSPSYCSRHIHRSTHTYIPGRCESKEAL